MSELGLQEYFTIKYLLMLGQFSPPFCSSLNRALTTHPGLLLQLVRSFETVSDAPGHMILPFSEGHMSCDSRPQKAELILTTQSDGQDNIVFSELQSTTWFSFGTQV
jgi:hypothetical protein